MQLAPPTFRCSFCGDVSDDPSELCSPVQIREEYNKCPTPIERLIKHICRSTRPKREASYTGITLLTVFVGATSLSFSCSAIDTKTRLSSMWDAGGINLCLD